MKFKSISKVKNRDEARQIAMNYQQWASEKSMSWSEVAKYNEYLTILAKKFKLTKEFRENGLI